MSVFGDDDSDSMDLFTELGFDRDMVVEPTDHNVAFMIQRSPTIPPEISQLSEDVAVRFGAASCANIFRTLVSAQLRRVFMSGDLRFVEATRRSVEFPMWRIVDTAVLFGLVGEGNMYCLEPFEILFCFDRDFKIFWMTHVDREQLFA
jgi:hypothetical protein